MVYGPDRAAQTDGELNQTSQWAATAPCASWKGEGKGAMWGMWGKCRGVAANMGHMYVREGHMWPVCTSRTLVGEREVGR